MLSLAGLAAVAFLLGQRIQSPAQALADALPPGPTLITVPVEERQLVDTVVFRADVALGDSLDVEVPYSEAVPIVTEVSLEEGQTIEEGETILSVNGTMRFILQGQLPPYRDLTPGLSGPDVAQLQEALTRLDYEVGRQGVFDWATQRAARTMFADRGSVLPIDQEQGGVVIEREWIVYVPELPARVVSSTLRLGMDLRNAASPPFALSNSSLRAFGSVEASLVADLAPGQRVEVLSGSTTIEAVVLSIELPSPGTRNATLTIEFLEGPPATWRGLNVRVEAVFERTPGPVLAVPVSAVYGDASGQAFVERLEEDGATRRVDVEVGAVAGGYVQIVIVHGTLNVGDPVVVGHAG